MVKKRTADDIAAMRALTAQAVRAGALGFSSSRTLNHRSSRGAPTPSLQAELDELFGIAAGLRDAQAGVIEMISDFDDVDREFSYLEAMVRESGRPMSISLAQGLNPHGWRKLLGHIEAANTRGLSMRGQVAPRAIGILLGNRTTLNPFSTRPSLKEIADLPLEARLRVLGDPHRKARILAESPTPAFKRLFGMIAGAEKLWELAIRRTTSRRRQIRSPPAHVQPARTLGARGLLYPCALLQVDGYAGRDVYERSLGAAILAVLPLWADLQRVSQARTSDLDCLTPCSGGRHCGGGCLARAYLPGRNLTAREDRCELRRAVYAWSASSKIHGEW